MPMSLSGVELKRPDGRVLRPKQRPAIAGLGLAKEGL